MFPTKLLISSSSSNKDYTVISFLSNVIKWINNSKQQPIDNAIISLKGTTICAIAITQDSQYLFTSNDNRLSMYSVKVLIQLLLIYIVDGMQIMDVFYYNNYQRKALPSWIQFIKINNSFQILVDKQGSQSLTNPTQNLLLVKTQIPITSTSFIFSEIPTDATASQQIYLFLKQNNFISSNNLVSSAFDPNTPINLSSLNVPQVQHLVDLVTLTLQLNIYYNLIAFKLSNSLSFDPTSDQMIQTHPSGVTVQITIDVQEPSDGTFVQKQYPGVIVSISKNGDTILIYGSIASVNSILKQKIFFYIAKNLKQNNNFQVNMVITDGLNPNLLKNYSLSDTLNSFIHLKSYLTQTAPFLDQLNEQFSDAEITILQQTRITFLANTFNDQDGFPINYEVEILSNKEDTFIALPSDCWLKFYPVSFSFNGIAQLSLLNSQIVQNYLGKHQNQDLLIDLSKQCKTSETDQKQQNQFCDMQKKKKFIQRHRALSVQEQRYFLFQKDNLNSKSIQQKLQNSSQNEEESQIITNSFNKYQNNNSIRSIFEVIKDQNIFNCIFKYLNSQELFYQFRNICKKARHLIKYFFLEHNYYYSQTIKDFYNKYFCLSFTQYIADKLQAKRYLRQRLQKYIDQEVVKKPNSISNNSIVSLFNVALQFQGYKVELNQTYETIKKIGVEKCFSYLYDVTSLPCSCAEITLKELQRFNYLKYDIIYSIILQSIIYRIQFQKNIETFKELARKEYIIQDRRVIKNIKIIPLKKNKWVFDHVGKNQFYLIFTFLNYEHIIKMRNVSRNLKVIIDNYITELIPVLQSQSYSKQKDINTLFII
ncbi:hypothetical protein ABPG72_009377 [Tetrahymena utriculariae]